MNDNVTPINGSEWYMDVVEAAPVNGIAVLGTPTNWQVELSCGHKFVFGTVGERPVKVLCIFCKTGINPVGDDSE